MNCKIELPQGFVFRVVDKDGFRHVACVAAPGYHECGSCVFRYLDDSCPFACCMEDRVDRKEVCFIEVADWKGGKE